MKRHICSWYDIALARIFWKKIVTHDEDLTVIGYKYKGIIYISKIVQCK